MTEPQIVEPETGTDRETLQEQDNTPAEDPVPVQDKLAIYLVVSDSDDEDTACQSPVPSLCNSPKITLEEPPLITHNQNYESTKHVTTHSRACSYNNDAILLREMHTAQQNRIALNLGEKKFETSVPTLNRESLSILAKMTRSISPIRPYLNDGLQTFFLDRDPSIFTFILDYLRNGMKVVRLW